MEIKNLRQIGRRLIDELPPVLNVPGLKTPLGQGAGGDKTFPVDRKAEEIILSALEELGEPLSIISEETGVQELRGGGKRVIIDPVDGSKNAINGIPFFGASIAVARGESIGDIELAYVINLVNGDEFWAEKGRGTYLNGAMALPQPDRDFFLIAYEAQTPERDLPRILPLLSKARRTRCLGAIALDLAYLASGSISVFITPAPARSFDFAGGWLLVKEAGAVITDMAGAEIQGVQIGLHRSVPILASGNKELHKRSVEILSGK